MDVLDDPRDRGFELLALHVRGELGRLGDASGAAGAGTAPRRRSRISAIVARGALVGGVDAALVVGEGAGEDRQLVAQVVEDEHRVGDHQRHVGQAERVGVGLAERLDRAHQVVAEEADGAAGEGRQVLDRGRLEGAEARGDGAVGVGRRLDCGRLGAGGGLAAPLRERAVAPAQDRAGAEADERVAADLALLGGLEQEAGRALGLAGAQLEEGRDRRLAVVDEAGPDRDDVALAGQLAGLARGSARAAARRGSAATAIEHLHHRRLRDVARDQQHAEVVEQVGRLFGDPLVGLLAGGADDLLGLLLDLLADQRRVVEQLDRVAALGALGGAAAQRPLERRQRLVGDAARARPGRAARPSRSRPSPPTSR